VNDPHCVAGLLKQYVRMLPGGLINGKAQPRYIAASSTPIFIYFFIFINLFI
jgi:hypothetical protein